LIDTAGSELGIVSEPMPSIGIGDTVQASDGRQLQVVDVYDDEAGQEGDVQATLVVDDGSDVPTEQLLHERSAELLNLVDELGFGERLEEIARLRQRLEDIHRTDSPEGGDSRLV
jgi:hypothetical protein